MQYDVERARARFPALSITDDGRRRIYLDNPAGTQVPQSVVDRMSACLIEANANLGGFFVTSRNADVVMDNAHAAMADMLNAPSPNDIVFGQNMTTLTLHLSRSIGRMLSRGDEIIVTRMDHDANIAPWLLLAEDLGLEIRWLPFNTETFEFEIDTFTALLSDKTRLVCLGGASNMIGTLHDIKTMCGLAREAGAWTFIDAVQSAPHVSTDVQDIGCDFLSCSGYKFFGPHQGILYGRAEVMQQLPPYKVRPAADEMPGAYETGTQSHEGAAGVAAAVDYFAWIGATMATEYHERYAHFAGRRQQVHAAMDCLFDYEAGVATRLIEGLQQLPGVRILGITDPAAMHRRVPTVSFVVEGDDPERIAKALAEENIFVWNGHNYALEAAMLLGILDQGSAVRVGPVHYNTIDEIDQLLNSLDRILAARDAA